MIPKFSTFLAGALILLPVAAFSQTEGLDKWPRGKTPEEIGNIVSSRYLVSPWFNYGRPGVPRNVTYPEVCTWFGALRFAEITGNDSLIGELEERFLPLFGRDRKMVPVPYHVDYNVFGTVPLTLYRLTGNKAYRSLGMYMADTQWIVPEVIEAPAKPELRAQYEALAAEGLSWQTRYWIDDMFMVSAVQIQAYRTTGDRKYVDRAALQMNAYLDKIQRPNGLFYHTPEVAFFWGRGNGWMAVGMADLLADLPKDNPYRERILNSYRKMMETLRENQRPDGMWGQLIDVPESWAETSSTGMFTYAMIKGVKNGWLDTGIYTPVIRKAWIALTGYLNADGDMTEVCEGTNAKADRQYYFDRGRIIGDMHGQAPMLWCAVALLEK